MKRLLAGAAVAALLSVPSFAAAATYTSLSAFQTAAGATALENFNSSSQGVLGSPSSPVVAASYGAFTISGSSNGDYVAIAPGSMVGNIDGSNFLYLSEYHPSNGSADGDGGIGPTITLTFASAIKAFGFDWADRDGTDSYRIDFSGPGFTPTGFTNPPFAINAVGSGFFGFTSDTAFTTVTFTQNQSGGVVEPFGIDNIRSSVASAPVPEPATWAMMIGGFGLVGGAMRRRHSDRALRVA